MNKEPATLKALARRFKLRLASMREFERLGWLRPVGTADDGSPIYDPVATLKEIERGVVALGKLFQDRRP